MRVIKKPFWGSIAFYVSTIVISHMFSFLFFTFYFSIRLIVWCMHVHVAKIFNQSIFSKTNHLVLENPSQYSQSGKKWTSILVIFKIKELYWWVFGSFKKRTSFEILEDGEGTLPFKKGTSNFTHRHHPNMYHILCVFF